MKVRRSTVYTAYQFDGDYPALQRLVGDHRVIRDPGVSVWTQEGICRLGVGDYIIMDGTRFWRCKEQHFALDYTPIQEDA